MFFAANGWFVTNGLDLTTPVLYVISALYLWLSPVTLYAIYVHYHEYMASAPLIVRIEKALGVYKTGRYLADESLFILDSMQWGTGKYSRHIVIAYFTMVLLLLSLSISMLFIINSAPK